MWRLMEGIYSSLLLKGYPLNFFIDKEEKHLFSYSSPLFQKNFGKLLSIPGEIALQKYGIDILDESIEKGYSELRRKIL